MISTSTAATALRRSPPPRTLLEADPSRNPDVAAGERGEILEQGCAPPSHYVEQIVSGERQGQLRLGRERVPVERGVDHRIAWRVGFDRCGAVVREGTLNLQPAVELTALAGNRANDPERWNERRRAKVFHCRMHGVA